MTCQTVAGNESSVKPPCQPVPKAACDDSISRYNLLEVVTSTAIQPAVLKRWEATVSGDQMTMSTTHYDALIIGSGFSGLYALHHLRDRMGLKVRAFDAAAVWAGPGGTTGIPAHASMHRAVLFMPTPSRRTW